MISYYDDNQNFIGELKIGKFELSVRTVANGTTKYPQARYALYISDDNSKEFHVYKITNAEKFIVECIL